MNWIINQEFTLTVQLNKEDTGYFPQVVIYDPQGEQTAVLNMTHVVEGLYRITHTLDTTGTYTCVYKVYEDASHTTASDLYPFETESLVINEETVTDTQIAGAVWGANITQFKNPNTFGFITQQILGLSKSNFRITQTVYDAKGRLTSALITIYDTPESCEAGTNPIGSYRNTSEYNQAGNLTSYKVVEE